MAHFTNIIFCLLHSSVVNQGYDAISRVDWRQLSNYVLFAFSSNEMKIWSVIWKKGYFGQKLTSKVTEMASIQFTISCIVLTRKFEQIVSWLLKIWAGNICHSTLVSLPVHCSSIESFFLFLEQLTMFNVLFPGGPVPLHYMGNTFPNFWGHIWVFFW